MSHQTEQFCVECGDQPATLYCKQCKDQYCEVCFGAQHRRGNRFRHEWKDLKDDLKNKGGSQGGLPIDLEIKEKLKEKEDKVSLKDEKAQIMDMKERKEKEDSDLAALDEMAHVKSEWFMEDPTPEWFVERSKFIPLRLTEEERTLLNLVESCLDVSEYTDKIDVFSHSGKEKRIQGQLYDVCQIISGLKIATDYASGKKLFQGKSFKDSGAFFQWVFEVARRHKIRNPEKMRTEYGKLMFLLQDSQMEEIQQRLGFSLVKDIVTVHTFLEEKKCLELLGDKLMPLATGEVLSEGKTRADIEKSVKGKQDAIKRLAQKYKKDDLSEEDVKLCILSIGDNHSFLRSNRDVVEQMMGYLNKYFHPDKAVKPYSLSIRNGVGGSCLSHDHRTQFFFVLQSLTLWRDILHDMFRLWYLTECDLLDPDNGYRLRNTGQGLNRMQSCPRIGRAMSEIVSNCHHKMGRWVGLSVVHLGDRDVPNALVFIDKYNQVSRILTPIATCIRDLEKLYSVPELKRWIDKAFDGLENLRMEILSDFFKHAFDGSGDDGGSCIDGRLTSSWNWCSLLGKKAYYPVFLLTGFVGFDGNF